VKLSPAPLGRRPDTCENPRPVHGHWCGWCATGQLFSFETCHDPDARPFRCRTCGSVDWRDEEDVAASDIGRAARR
jgi:hypothetical protein